jgi:hypothetical protein
MFMQNLIFLILISFLFSKTYANTNLGLLIEPSINLERSDTSVNYPNPLSKSTGLTQGFGLGARVAFQFKEVVFLGLDGRYSRTNYLDSSIHYDANATSYNWGPVIGMQMPLVGLRIWGSYIVGSEMNPERSGELNINFNQGTGYRVGAGVKFLMVSFNLELQQINYRNTNLESVGPFETNTNFSSVSLINNSWIASISFPLGI